MALTRLVGLHGADLDEDRLVAVLSDMDLDDEIERARVFRKTFGGSAEEALQRIFIKAYNKGLRDGRLPEA